MECKVNWVPQSGMAMLAESGSGHAVVMDVAPESGGRNLGVRPMEMLLMGTAGCTTVDVVHILKKGRHDVRGCEVRIQGERAQSEPKVFVTLNFHFVVTGKGLTREVVERAIHLSHEKYCSASIMMAKTAQISTSFEVIEAA
jgi:putative redox protein